MKNEEKLIGAIIFFGLLAAASASKMQGRARAPARARARAPARARRIQPIARNLPHHPHPPHDPAADEYRGSSADTDPEMPEPNPEAPEDEGYTE